MQIKPKPTNKTTSEQKTTKATIFLSTNTSKRGKTVYFTFFFYLKSLLEKKLKLF